MPHHDANITRIEGPVIATGSGAVAKTVKIFDYTDNIPRTLHIEVAEADQDDPEAWKTAIEANGGGYTLLNWT